MVFRPVVLTVICVGLFLILESLMLSKAMALKTNGFRMEDQRTHGRRNYMLQRARDKQILTNFQKRGASYDTEIEPLDAVDTIPEQLAYILDYANTIDDEYFLDKSVETRTRKRGNIKLEKHSNQAIKDPPCSCHHSNWSRMLSHSLASLGLFLSMCHRVIFRQTSLSGKRGHRAGVSQPAFASLSVFSKDYYVVIGFQNTWKDLADDVFPRKLPARVCNNTLPSGCLFPYKCREIYHDVPILKKKSPIMKSNENFLALVPSYLNISWYAELIEVAVGCQCLKEYKEKHPLK